MTDQETTKDTKDTKGLGHGKQRRGEEGKKTFEQKGTKGMKTLLK
jgi:hypothetical protein